MLLLSGLVERARGIARAFWPEVQTFRGAASGLVLVSSAVLFLQVVFAPSDSTSRTAGLVLALVIALVALVAGAVLAGSIRIAAAVPWGFWWALTSSFVQLSLAFMLLPPKAIVLSLLVVLAASILAGGGLASWRTSHPGPTRLVGLLAAVAGLVVLAAGLRWLLWDGPGEPRLPKLEAGSPVAPLLLPDPSTPGRLTVRRLTYGSGKDRHRPEFGDRVDIRTPSVDASPFLSGWSGAAGRARTRYWGFDESALPLQGRVDYPEGPGPFPLVLVVHGNHEMKDFSDAGFAYLAELLASRGFVVVSVDENFLNATATDLLALPSPVGLVGEGAARAILLLEHLRLWRGWSTGNEGPFAGKVDMGRIALVGHSRGGEAASLAAGFNRLSRFPDDARIRFDYGFGIRAIVAIAPVDGLYRPAAVAMPLTDVSYFTLHGTHDGEVSSFLGTRQYQRLRFTGESDWFKAALYVHRANHALWNSSWEFDSWGLATRYFNLASLLPRGTQEKLAKVFVTAFLEAALNDRAGYRALFRDYQVGAAWLPEVTLVQQYEDARTRVLADFEEDLDVTSTTLAGGSIQAEGLTDWKERRINLKWDPIETRAVILGWNRRGAEAPAWYGLNFASGLSLLPESALTFQLADKRGEPSPPLRGETPGTSATEPTPADSTIWIDLTVELVDAKGGVARLPLSSRSPLRRQIESDVLKSRALSNAPRSEVVFQTFTLPLASFAAANPAFNPREARTIRFVFDRTRQAVVILDSVGLRSSAPGD